VRRPGSAAVPIPCREDDVGLQLQRDRAHQIGAGYREDIGDDDAERRSRVGDHLGHRFGLRHDRLRPDRIGDAEFGKGAIEMERARAPSFR
jgi:hypothetical protein